MKMPSTTDKTIISSHTNYWQALRGFAILMVGVYHQFFFCFYHNAFYLIGKTSLPGANPFYINVLESCYINIGTIAVSLFFFLSGYFISHSIQTLDTRWQFLWNRVLRIWPVYAIGLCLSIMCLIMFSTRVLTSKEIFVSMFLLRPWFQLPFIDGSVWYIEIIVCFYLVCTIGFNMIKQGLYGRFIKLIFWLSFVIITFYTNNIEHLVSRHADMAMVGHTLTKFFSYIALTTVGVITWSWHSDRKEGDWGAQAFLCLLCLILYCVGGQATSHRDIMHRIFSLGIAILIWCSVYFCYWRGFALGFLARFLCYMGKISYSYYVFHVIPGYLITYALWPSLSYGANVLGLIFPWISAYILYIYGEKPIYRWSCTFKQRKVKFG